MKGSIPKSNILRRIFNKDNVTKEVSEQKDVNPIILSKTIDNNINVFSSDLVINEELEGFQRIFDNLSSGIWIRECLSGSFVYASKGLEDILDIPLTTLYKDPKTWDQLIHPQHREEVLKNMEFVLKGKTVKMVYRLNSSGKTKWILEEVVPKLDEKGQVHQMFGMVKDVTHEFQIEEKLNYLEDYDFLTGLPNQKSLFNKLDSYCKDEAFSLLYLNIDRFNVINNSLGYQIGDKALKQVANRFSMLTPTDGFLARLSGNDFIMVIKKNTNEKEVSQFAEEIIKTIQQPFIIEDYVLHLTTSIGITFYPEEGKDKLALLENAHVALYQAKRQGKNNYQLYSHSKDIPSYKKYVLDRDMRQAILNDEFELYFQPQVEPSKGYIAGAEVLLRWHHPEWGDISPGEFIPLAEENHMINLIIDWEIEKVCMHLKEWSEKKYRLYPISINISPIRFMKKGLAQYVETQIKKYNVNPKYIELEITESSLLKTDDNVLSILKELKELGVKVSIDDFGTGYSSLDYLRKIQPDTIKIDKTFINNINAQSEIDKGVIASVLFLGKRLGMQVVAEGVEDFEQLEFLKQNECDIIQGFLFSEPVPKGKYEKMIQVGFLKAEKRSKRKSGTKENRKFYRFELPFHIHGKMTIAEVNNQIINVGSTPILIENISLGGIKILSNLKLPVNSNMKFKLEFKILNEIVEGHGALRWVHDEHPNVYSYGVKFNLNRNLEDRLARLINRLTTIRIKNEVIPDTEFVYEQAHSYFSKH